MFEFAVLHVGQLVFFNEMFGRIQLRCFLDYGGGEAVQRVSCFGSLGANLKSSEHAAAVTDTLCPQTWSQRKVRCPPQSSLRCFYRCAVSPPKQGLLCRYSSCSAEWRRGLRGPQSTAPPAVSERPGASRSHRASRLRTIQKQFLPRCH